MQDTFSHLPSEFMMEEALQGCYIERGVGNWEEVLWSVVAVVVVVFSDASYQMLSHTINFSYCHHRLLQSIKKHEILVV